MEEGRVGKRAFFTDELQGATVADHSLVGDLSLILKTSQRSETPFVAHHEFLTTGEFVLSSAESLQSRLDVLLVKTDRVKDSTDFDTSGFSVALSESSSHTGLKSISSCA